MKPRLCWFCVGVFRNHLLFYLKSRVSAGFNRADSRRFFLRNRNMLVGLLESFVVLLDPFSGVLWDPWSFHLNINTLAVLI